MEDRWSNEVASALAALAGSDRPHAITWYNHYTIQKSLQRGVDLAGFDFIGIDGAFLRNMLDGDLPRTSADLVIPRLVSRLPGRARIGIIGSTREQLSAAVSTIEGWPSRPEVVLHVDGYDGMADPQQVIDAVNATQMDALIIGLGAPLQDIWALDLKRRFPDVSLILTCGGWIDQVTHEGYYPKFAYKFRLNWLIRVGREPGRLWRRYTGDAFQAWRHRGALREALLVVGGDGVRAMRQISRG